jgi:hypothetical protein
MHFRSAGSLPWLRSALVRAALLFTLCLPGLLWAQVSITGKITGVVTDSSGAVVPNATVEVTSPALMASRSAHTQSDGSYLFDLLPPGAYEVKVTANGFQTLERTGISLNAGFTATVNCRLQVGELKQTVVVQGEPVVDVQSVQVQTTFDQNLLQQIPAGATRGPQWRRCRERLRPRLTWGATRPCSSPPCRCMAALRQSRFSASTG